MGKTTALTEPRMYELFARKLKKLALQKDVFLL